jgi:hypothetical protein
MKYQHSILSRIVFKGPQLALLKLQPPPFFYWSLSFFFHEHLVSCFRYQYLHISKTNKNLILSSFPMATDYYAKLMLSIWSNWFPIPQSMTIFPDFETLNQHSTSSRKMTVCWYTKVIKHESIKGYKKHLCRK